jgi:hypothetical protein
MRIADKQKQGWDFRSSLYSIDYFRYPDIIVHRLLAAAIRGSLYSIDYFRYPDIMVHRLLAAAIGADNTYSDLLDKASII